jgi:dTDP-4-dehydrorhamnose reductase
MKILVIGADGQLGSDCRILLAPEHALLTPSLAELDFCRLSGIDPYITKEHPDIIINCAAYTAVDKCEQEVDLCRQINADGPRTLAGAAEKIGAKLIHISTDYVFDGRKPIPEAYREEDAVHPLSQYGRTKLAGEEAVRSHCANHLILRTAWLYSAHGPNFLKTMLRLTVQNPDRELKVVNDQYGSLTWSSTLARQIQRLLPTDLTGTLHATAEGYSTWYAGACTFLEAMGVAHNLRPCTTTEYPTLAHRPANSILANARLDNAGMSTFVHWRDDIEIFVKEHKEKLLAEIPKSCSATPIPHN